MIRLVALFAALFVAQVTLAVDLCVAPGGTATTGTCAGAACTDEEWATAAVCYPMTQMGITNAMVASSAGPANTVTIADGTVPITTGVTPTAASASGGTLTVRCRTPQQAACIMSSSGGTSPIFSLVDTDANDFTFKYVGFTRTAPITNTSIAAGAINATGAGTGNITLDTVRIWGIDTDWTGLSVPSFGGIVNFGSAASNKTLYVINSEIDDITLVAASAGPVIFRLAGTQDLNISGLTMTNVKTQGAARLIECADACTLAGLRIGTETERGWDASETTTADIINGAVYHTDTSLPLIVTDSVMRNSRLVGTSPRGGFIDTVGPTTLVDVTCRDMEVIASDVADPSTACVFGTTATAIVTSTREIVDNVTAQYGGGFYLSQGASGTFNGLRVSNSRLKTGIMGYCGGWGDCTINSPLVYGNTQLPGGETDDGGVWYCQLHSTATRDRTCAVTGGTLVANQLSDEGGNYGGVAFRNNVTNDAACGSATCDHTMTVTNTIIQSGNMSVTAEFLIDNLDADPTNTLNIVTSALTESSSPATNTGAGSPVVNLSNLKEGDPGFLGGPNPTTAEGFRLRPDSQLIRAGVCVLTTGCIPYDFGGRRSRVPPDIGVWQIND